MQVITKNIRWWTLMETYQIAKFDRSPNNLSQDIGLTDRWPEKRNIRKAKTVKKKRKTKITRIQNLHTNSWSAYASFWCKRVEEPVYQNCHIGVWKYLIEEIYRISIWTLFLTQRVEIELIFALQAAISEIRAAFRNCRIWTWNLEFEKSARSCTWTLFLP